MSFVVARRKITAPPLPSTIVSRTSLIHRLTEVTTTPAHPKLILLNAPAGYGKTTLLAEFAAQSPLPCCWAFLERGDADPLLFLRLLLASLRHCFPTFGTDLLPLLGDPALSTPERDYPQTVLEALLEAITRELTEPFALLLCHYQEISTATQISPLLEYLLHHLPDDCVLFLESREVPELDFASLLAGRAMLGIGQDLLRFSASEIQELARLQNSQPLSLEEAEQLATSFDGWVIGLLLGTRLGGIQFLQRPWRAPLPRKGTRKSVHTQTLFSYVVNEVFQHHQEAYTFLKEAVVLQELSPPLCADLLGLSLTEVSQQLQYLEQHGLFVTQVADDDEQPLYRCHPVLRDLLYEELRQQYPERFVQLHRRAAELLGAAHDYEQAIYHALEAQVDEIAAQLLIASAEQMMVQGQMETLQQWISAFSEGTLARYPKLLLIQATMALRKSEAERIPPLLEQLTRTLESQPSTLAHPEDLPLLQAERELVRAQVSIQQGQHQQAQQLCEQVLAHLPADEIALRAQAHTILGTCASQRGEPHQAIEQYQKALQLQGRHTISRWTASEHHSLAEAYRRLGNFTLAEHHIARSAACWQQLGDMQGIVNNLIGQACTLWEQGNFAEGEELLQQALVKANHPLHLQRMQSYVLVNLGELAQDQGLYERSLTQTEEGLALARQLSDASLFNYALLTLALTYLYMGDATTASLLLSDLRLESVLNLTVPSGPQIQRDLAQSTIWLHQRRYTEAFSLLVQAEAALRTTGIKREHLKALLRLAACCLGLRQETQVMNYLAEVEHILADYDAYVWQVHSELRVLPELQRLVEHQPNCASLRILLRWTGSTHDSVAVEATEIEDAEIQETEREVPVASLMLTTNVESSSSRLKILALGEPVVLLDDQPITRWRMARAMELCFYLLECARPMRKEQIITALWEEVDEQTAQTFYSTMHYLRKALGGESTIKSRAGVYTLDLSALYGSQGVWYDVAAFEEQYALGKQALLEEVDETAQAAFRAMIEFYRGDYVQPFYSDWCTGKRDRLKRLYLDARQQLALIAWRAEEIEESVEHWQQMLAVDPCLEEAHYGVMRGYIRQGKRGLALRQYQRCSETLQQELGVGPGPAMQNLYRRLMGLPKNEPDA